MQSGACLDGGWTSALLPDGRLGVILRRMDVVRHADGPLPLGVALDRSSLTSDSTLPAVCSMLELTQAAECDDVPGLLGGSSGGLCVNCVVPQVRGTDGTSGDDFCRGCIADIFPFGCIVNNGEFRGAI